MSRSQRDFFGIASWHHPALGSLQRALMKIKILTPRIRIASTTIQRFAALLSYGTVFFLTVLWQPGSQPRIDIEKVSLYLVLSGLTAMIHLILNREQNWMRIDTVFLLGYLIVNFQWPAMILVGQPIPMDTRISTWIEGGLTFGTWLATLGLTSWAIGYAIPRRKPLEKIQFVTNLFDPAILQAVLIVTFLIVVEPAYLTGDFYKEVRQGGFVTITGPEAYLLVIVNVIGVSIMLASIYNFFASAQVGRPASFLSLLSSLPMLLTLVYVILFLIAGERGEVVQMISGGAIAICSSLRPLRFRMFALFVACGSVLLAFQGFARAQGYDNFAQFFENFRAWDATLNLANSAITVCLGLEILEARGQLFWGQLWVTNILALVPFAQSAFVALTGISQFELNSAYLMAVYVFGPNPHTSYGTSLAIDIYMNFGTTGVIFFMAAYGHICRVSQTFLSARYGIFYFLAAGMFASLAFYISRSGLLIQLQPVVWSYFFAVFIFKVRELWRAGGR